jgi:hypothetical protein
MQGFRHLSLRHFRIRHISFLFRANRLGIRPGFTGLLGKTIRGVKKVIFSRNHWIIRCLQAFFHDRNIFFGTLPLAEDLKFLGNIRLGGKGRKDLTGIGQGFERPMHAM